MFERIRSLSPNCIVIAIRSEITHIYRLSTAVAADILPPLSSAAASAAGVARQHRQPT